MVSPISNDIGLIDLLSVFFFCHLGHYEDGLVMAADMSPEIGCEAVKPKKVLHPSKTRLATLTMAVSVHALDLNRLPLMAAELFSFLLSRLVWQRLVATMECSLIEKSKNVSHTTQSQ